MNWRVINPVEFVCRSRAPRGHTTVTRLLEAGIPYPVVASMMGWSAATAIRMAKRVSLRKEMAPQVGLESTP
jgi:hypothetical protein